MLKNKLIKNKLEAEKLKVAFQVFDVQKSNI
jgi:hypothetical protein